MVWLDRLSVHVIIIHCQLLLPSYLGLNMGDVERSPKF